jgi:hypothetical protein
MAAIDSTRSNAFAAASRALDHAIEAMVDGRASHPSGTTFVPADLARDDSIAKYRKTGPVTIVDADGNETRLGRGKPGVEIILWIIVGAAVAWALRRSPRLPV